MQHTVESLFDRLVENNENVHTIPPAVQAIERPWYQGGSPAKVTVSRIRRQILNDHRIA